MNLHSNRTIFITIFCLFTFFFSNCLVTAQNQAISDLISGKTSDFRQILSDANDSELPALKASIKVLKFKALYNEVSLTVGQINIFDELIAQRIDSSSEVSFVETETHTRKINAHAFKINGQEIIVPAHYLANRKLTIQSYYPKGEAGTIFPEISIEAYSKTSVKKVTFAVNGKNIPIEHCTTRYENNSYFLHFCTDITAESYFPIGTHTVKIILQNLSGEKVEFSWPFTVGVKNIATHPLPESAKQIKVISIDPKRLLPGKKVVGELAAIIYKDKNGKIYTEYQLTTPSGITIKSQNLAFIRKKYLGSKVFTRDITISPKTDCAFHGQHFNFSYAYSGDGKVIKEKWLVKSNSVEIESPSIELDKFINATIFLTVEVTYVENGEVEVYTFDIDSKKRIEELELTTSFRPYRNLKVKLAQASHKVDISVASRINLLHSSGPNLHEGLEVNDNGGTLKIDRHRWKIQNSKGEVKVENDIATKTKLIFSKSGHAELIVEVAATWSQYGETYKHSFKPVSSSLIAFYLISEKSTLEKYPQGVLVGSERQIKFSKIDFQVNEQKRTIKTKDDFIFAKPIDICESQLWPASTPIKITSIAPVIYDKKEPPFNLGNYTSMNLSTARVHDNIETPFLYYYYWAVIEYTGQPYEDKNIFFRDLPAIPVYAKFADLVDIEITPNEDPIVFSGIGQEFKAEVLPKDGLGTGKLNIEESTLNLLGGYKLKKSDYTMWYGEQIAGEMVKKEEESQNPDFKYLFDPFGGPGSYNLNFFTSLTFSVDDTSNEIPENLEAQIPVTVLPGLEIITPYEELHCPLDSAIKVTTNFDSEEDLDKWKNISWKLDGKDISKNSDAPPFYIYVHKEGLHTLEGIYKTEHPITGKPIVITAIRKFYAKPFNVSLTPSKKLLSFDKQKTQNLNLEVEVSGNQIEKPGVVIPWQEGINLVIEPVEWELTNKPSGVAKITSDENSFDASLTFERKGATTVTAKVITTVQFPEKLVEKLKKKSRGKFEMPSFEFPIARADLWAVEAGPMSNFQGVFPPNAIAKAYRTFKLDSFDFSLHSSSVTEHAYSNGKLKPEVVLNSALPGTKISASNVDLKWSAEDISDTSDKFVVKPKGIGSYEVNLEPTLKFNDTNKINMGLESFPLEVVDFFSLINTKIKPNDFTIAFGEKQLLTCEISNKTKPSVKAFSLLDGAYKLIIKNIEWTEALAPDKQSVISSVYEYLAKEAGKIKGQAEVTMVVAEILPNGQGNDSDEYIKNVDWKCNVSKQKAIIINPLESMIYPLHSSLKVQTNYDAPKDLETWRKIKWKLNGKEFKPDTDKPSFYLHFNHIGKWKLEAELAILDQNTKQEVLLKDSVNFSVKKLDVQLSPNRTVLDFNEQKSQTVNLSISANDTTAETFNEKILWDKKNKIYAKVTNIAWSLKSTNKKTKLVSDSKKHSATLNFSGTDATTVQATVTVELIGVERLFKKLHPNYKGKIELPLFTQPAVRSDIWAVQVKDMDLIKYKFPQKAIVGLERTFEVNYFTFKVNDIKRSYVNPKGIDKEVIIPPAIPGVSSVKASTISFEWFAESIDKKDKANDGSKFKFLPYFAKKYKVKFISKLTFESKAIKIGEKSDGIEAFKLDDLISAKVTPASFTINLGESKLLTCHVWTADTSEPDPPPISAKKQILTILNGAYEVEITKVEWKENSVSAKQFLEASTYNYTAKQLGVTTGETLIYMQIREVIQDGLSGLGDKQGFFNYIKSLFWKSKAVQYSMKIYGNGKPLSSETYYWGQKVELSYKLFDAAGKEVKKKASSPKWEIDKPVIGLLSISSDEKSGKYYEIDPTALNNHVLRFYVYSHDQSKTFKQIKFECKPYTLSTKKLSNTERLHFKKPIASHTFEITMPTVGRRKEGNSWYIGFDKNVKPGIKLFQEFTNKTEVMYEMNCTQLIKVYFERKIASGTGTYTEVLETVLNNSEPLSDYWLDTEYPWNDLPFDIYPSNKPFKTKLAADSPWVGLNSTSPLKNVISVSGKMEYFFYILAKPSVSGEVYFPISTYVYWEWSGSAKKLESNDWVQVGELKMPEPKLKILKSLPKWSDKFIGGKDPKWTRKGE